MNMLINHKQDCSPITNPVDCFLSAVFGAMANLQEAGDIAADAIRNNPNFIDEVCEKCPDMTPGFIRKMQLIGLKKLHPKLAINESPGVRRLARLPYSLQSQYVSNPVPLLIKNGHGWETLKVDVRNLTSEQARQVFSDVNVRDDGEQRAWLENQLAQRSAPVVKDVPYRITGRKVVFLQPCTLSIGDLASILARAES